MNWYAHLLWHVARWLRGPDTRWRRCLDCDGSILQYERSPGIYRPLFCSGCLNAHADRNRRAPSPAPSPHRN